MATIMTSEDLQRNNKSWHLNRSMRLTASRFYDICVENKSPDRIFCSSSGRYEQAINYGITYEQTGLSAVERFIERKLSPCGLYISKEYPFIGGSPDAVIKDTTGNIISCVEIKCPYTCRFSSEPPKYILKDKETGMFSIEKTSRLQFQTQAQIFVTGAKSCIVGIYTPDKTYVLETARDEHFITWMVNKLVRYYINYAYKYLVEQNVKIPKEITDCVRNLLLK